MQRKIFKKMLDGYYYVEVCASASEAKALLEKYHGQIAVLVSDVRMPEESGLDLLEYARDKYPNIIRILASAYAAEDGAEALSTDETFTLPSKRWRARSLSTVR